MKSSGIVKNLKAHFVVRHLWNDSNEISLFRSFGQDENTVSSSSEQLQLQQHARIQTGTH